MKLAYLATDRSAVKTAEIINKYYTSIDYYFVDNKSNEMDLEIDRLPIMTKGLCIPSDKNLLTAQHRIALKEINKNFTTFLSQIYVFKNLSIELVDTCENTSYQEYKLSDINFIKYNKEIQKYTIENSRQEIIEYDYLLVENNQIMMNAIIDKQQNMFYSFTEQSKILLSLEYKIKNNHQTPQIPMDFIYIHNASLKSSDDNWYICRMEDKRILISFYIPIEMHFSDSYAEFIISRVYDVFSDVSDAFKIGDYVGKSILPIDGHYTYKAKLRQPKAGMLVPTFAFWSRDKINHYINQVLKNKIKISAGQKNDFKPGKDVSP